MLNHGHGSIDKGVKSLLDGLDVVVSPTTGLGPLKQSLLHHVLWTVKEQNKLAGNDLLLKLFRLIQRTWEAVNQELHAIRGGNRLLEQLDGHRRRNKLALLHDLLQLLAHLGATSNLGPQQVAGRIVLEAILLHNLLALGSLSTSWATEHKHNFGIWVHLGLWLRLRSRGLLRSSSSSLISCWLCLRGGVHSGLFGLCGCRRSFLGGG